MQRKREFVAALGENKRKGWVKLGFSAVAGGMESREAVVVYLDEEQREWEESHPGAVLSGVRDEIDKVVHRGIGGTAWYGFRYFYPIRENKVTQVS